MRTMLLIALMLASLAAVGTSAEARYWHIPLAQLSTTSHTHVCVTGTVMFRKTEADGDIHLRIQEGKASGVAEIIPQIRLIAPHIGDRIDVCGIARYDRKHGWGELHPVTRIRTPHEPKEYQS